MGKLLGLNYVPFNEKVQIVPAVGAHFVTDEVHVDFLVGDQLERLQDALCRVGSHELVEGGFLEQVLVRLHFLCNVHALFKGHMFNNEVRTSCAVKIIIMRGL